MRHPRRTNAITTCLVLLAMLVLVRAPARAESEEARRFWATDALHVIHLRVTAEQWKAMQPVRARQGMLQRLAASQVPPPPSPGTQPIVPATRPAADDLKVRPPAEEPEYVEGQRLEPNFYGMEFAYVKGDAEVDGTPLPGVGIRLRGNSSYNWAGRGYQRPFKVDLNRFVDGQKYAGQTALVLNNNAYDPSLMREALAYETFRNLGVPAPRTSYALVFLTIDGQQVERECLGLYTLIEEIDSKAYLKDRFGSAKGLLLKPWSIRGLPYLGEDFAAYVSRYNPESDDVPPAAARRTIEFVKLVNYADDATFAREIGSYLDVDGFLRLLAGHVMLSNLDCFLYTGHNFYMYLPPKDGRFRLMPWDLNLAFGNFTSAASREQMVHLSLRRPHSGEMKLIDRLLAMPEHEQAYRRIFEEAIERHFNPKAIGDRIATLRQAIERADALADEAWAQRFIRAGATRPATIPARPRPALRGWQGQEAIDPLVFVERRVASLRNQLAGRTDGYSMLPKRPPTPPPSGLRAPPAMGNLPQIASAVLNGADGDCDGVLTREEAAAATEAFFRMAAPSGGNELERRQVVFAFAKLLTPVLERRGNRERDRARDAGRTTRLRPEDLAQLWAQAVFRALDAGAAAAAAAAEGADAAKEPRSAAVTLDRALAELGRAFAAADRDKSGRLDGDEVLLLLDAIAAPDAPSAKPN